MVKPEELKALVETMRTLGVMELEHTTGKDVIRLKLGPKPVEPIKAVEQMLKEAVKTMRTPQQQTIDPLHWHTQPFGPPPAAEEGEGK